jgi:hypothetical protein
MKIITSVVNNPLFIKLQHYTFQKYCKNDYEFIVFNDAKPFPDSSNGGDLTMKKQIENMCNELKIKCINVDNRHHTKINNFTDRHADVFNNVILKYQKDNPDKYFLLDSDMFLIDYFDFNLYDGLTLCGVVHTRKKHFHYTSPQIAYMDMTLIDNLEKFSWSAIPALADTGGRTGYWLFSKIPNIDKYKVGELSGKTINKIYFFKPHLTSLCWDETDIPINIKNDRLVTLLKKDSRNKNDKFFCEIYNDKFLHYRAGSNWMGEGLEFHNNFTKELAKILLN